MSLPRENRLQKSVFGQLKSQLEGSDGHQLRRSYIDVQDAGQERSFFVKVRSTSVCVCAT